MSAGTAVTVYDTKGEFIDNEVLSFKETLNEGQPVYRTASSVRTYGISDVKSVYSDTGIVAGAAGTAIVGINTFSANVIQSTRLAFNGASNVTTPDAGISTIFPIPTGLKVNDLVSFVNLGISSTVPVVARVTGVTTTEATVVGVYSSW